MVPHTNAARPRARGLCHLGLRPLGLLVALLAATRADAQPAVSAPLAVRGRVVDSASSPVPDAVVSAADPNGRSVATRTDQQGRFVLALAGRGRYVVQVRALGFDAATQPINARSPEDEPLLVRLQRARALSAVQVVGAGAQRTRQLSANDLAGSVSVLSGEQIAREQVSFAQELLKKVPGVYRAEFNQGIVAGDIGVRGFNTESDIASTKLLIDGIPSNLNSGVSEMNALFPLEIARMTVVRGTNDPRYGLFNLAGNVSVETQQGGSYLTSRVQTGSFGTREGQLLAAQTYKGFSQTLFGGLRRSDGYRDNAALDKWSASGKWFYTSPGERVRVGAIARMHRLDTDAPGYLTRAESRSTPRFSPAFSSSDGGTVASDHGSVHVDVRQTATLDWSLKGYSQRFDRVRFVRFTAAGLQQERVEDERQTGLIAQLTWRPASLTSYAVVASAGADVQQQENVQQRFRSVSRVRQVALRDYAFSLDNQGGFAQLAASPIDRLQLTAGVRVDRFVGDFNNRQTAATIPVFDYGTVTQPKASATLRLTDRVSSYANIGRAFQIGTGIAAYGVTPLAASKNDGVEAGVIARPAASVSLRAGVWQQRASDEVRLKFDNSGDSENIGRTERRGIDAEASWQLSNHVRLWGSGTSQRAVLVEPGRANATAAGKLLNHVPEWTGKYGADWSPARGVELSAWGYAQGDYHLTPQNDRGRWGDIHTVNADLSWRWRAAAIGVGITNLFDRYTEYVWWDGAQTLHSPGAGRALFLTFTIDR